MADMVKIIIDGRSVEAVKGSTIIEAARKNGFNIPTLCYYKSLGVAGSCRVCMVEVVGQRNLAAACSYPIREGLEIKINSERARLARRNSVELILSNHSKECLTCVKNQKCELQDVAQSVGARDQRFQGHKTATTIDTLSPSICRDTSKCILCGRCVAACKKYQEIGIIDFQNRGFETIIGPAENRSFVDVPCMNCGQCVNVCPTGALWVREDIDRVAKAISDPDKFVVVQTAPAVRASLGEEFNLPIGTRVTGKMVAALRRIGFDRVYDTNFAADLTIMEEGTELVNRVSEHLAGKPSVLPMITSCSPGWIRYCEFEHPKLLNNLSTCKSPHMMMGAIVKSYFAQKTNIDPKKIFVVSIMPCSAKKYEVTREEMIHDVDAVLTTRELGDMIKSFGIDFNSLPDESFDGDLLGEYTGAGVIFGVTGGVMEAALRTAYKVLQGDELPDNALEFEQIRGFEGVKEATVRIPKLDLDVKIAVAHSMANAEKLLSQIEAGTSPYHFIEIMGCPGGCINGGGQSFLPIKIANSENSGDYKIKRASVLYEEDRFLPKRRSHLNSQINDLYANFLEKPNSHKAHELLHTHYHSREKYPLEKK